MHLVEKRAIHVQLLAPPVQAKYGVCYYYEYVAVWKCEYYAIGVALLTLQALQVVVMSVGMA